ETVEVFSSGPPARAHADVALLEVEQYDDTFDGGTPEILAKLRQKAGEMGFPTCLPLELLVQPYPNAEAQTEDTCQRGK
ncbi:MAG TPA: hypothetical protein VKP30_03560, partial [Polyangiaceae bacterium]|nr:hypothetical protein [Polyangiaceae bacterium]